MVEKLGDSDIVSIRRANQEDAKQIAEVHVKSWQTTYQQIVDEETLAAMNWESRVDTWRGTIKNIEDNAIIFVAFKGERLVGFLSGGVSRQPLENCDSEIYAIYLLEEFRGEGTGKQLIEFFFEWLKEKDFHVCCVWVAEKNPYQAFYSSMGAEKRDYERVSRVGKNEIPTVAYIWDQI